MNIKRITVGTSSCGLAAGAKEVLDFLSSNIKEIPIIEVGCIGHCYAEPLVSVETENEVFYFNNVKGDEKTLRAILSLDPERRMIMRKERRDKERLKVTGLIGKFSPVDINGYIENSGFEALKKALSLKPEEIVSEVKISGLRGRGGGGFPTGTKWQFMSSKKAEKKILVCNADEGDPGAFMDRSLMESLPYQVLEGMLICAYAVGATHIYIYCRAEYPIAIKNVKIAIKKIEELGLNKINGNSIPIILKEGAGAFVCGEETALIASLEGKRGMPRFRPPFPTDSGYQNYPTMINNVETFANIPLIINEGGTVYSKIGTEKSKGTKLFALAGDVKYPGLVEVPMGITIGEIVFDIGGAKLDEVKAVQTGGPSGGCIPVELFNTPVDYDSLTSLGAIMGSGGMIVIGKNRCMVETARYFLDFTHKESCGKCTFCRVGAKRMFETLERITKGNGEVEDLDFLVDMGIKVKKGSLCGLGQSAPNPVLATLRYFKNEYDDHVVKKQCSALECSALVDVHLNKDGCIKCKICIKSCPVKAISDSFDVDNKTCTRCNSCIEVCPKKVIKRVPSKS